MKITAPIIIALITTYMLVCTSCPGPPEKYHVENLAWLTGQWKSSEEAAFYEHWEFKNNSTLLGHGFTLENGDTIFSEQLQIFASDSGIYYSALPSANNRDLPVYFKHDHHAGDSLLFHNPAHDFPKYIIFTKTTAGSLKIIVRDGFEEGSKGFELAMNKIN
jgi:hypothetical protein